MNYMITKGSIFGTKKPIAHGVNCMGVMGSGIAAQVRSRYPEVYQDYKEYCNSMDRGKLLGTVQYVMLPDALVLNCFTQYRYGTERRHADYDAIRACFENINKSGLKQLALPKIGCGLAGGDWNIVEKILLETLTDLQEVEVFVL